MAEDKGVGAAWDLDRWFDGRYDVVSILEPCIRSEALHLVQRDGFKLWASLYPENLEGPVHGGVLVYVREELKVKVLFFSVFSFCSVIWLRIGGGICMGFAYLPPETSVYLRHWPSDPLETVLEQAQGFHDRFNSGVILVGDLNARRAVAPDTRRSPRGRFLDQLPEGWTIPTDRQFTHLSTINSLSVIDYAVLSPTLTPRLVSFRTGVFCSEVSDHAPLMVELLAPAMETARQLAELPFAVPPLSSAALQPVDLAEKALLSKCGKRSRQSPVPQYKHDTTHINRSRRTLQSIIDTIIAEGLSPVWQDMARRERNRLSKLRKKAHFERAKHRFLYACSLDVSSYWTFARPILSDGKSSPTVDADALYTHYRSLLTGPETPIPEGPDGPHPEQFHAPFTEDEITSTLCKLKNSSAGEDQVSASQLKLLSPTDLCHFFNNVISSEAVPDSWKRSVLVPISKPGLSGHDPAQLHGIALQSCLRKLFTLCLTQRLQTYVEEHSLLPAFQGGFRPGYRASDNLFMLLVLHE